MKSNRSDKLNRPISNHQVVRPDRLSIDIDKILENEIRELSNNKLLKSKFSSELLSVRKNWSDFCKLYKLLKSHSKTKHKT